MNGNGNNGKSKIGFFEESTLISKFYTFCYTFLEYFKEKNYADRSKVISEFDKRIEYSGAKVVRIEQFPAIQDWKKVVTGEPLFGLTYMAPLDLSSAQVHVTPEDRYASFLISTCGQADPFKSLEGMIELVKPERVEGIFYTSKKELIPKNLLDLREKLNLNKDTEVSTIYSGNEVYQFIINLEKINNLDRKALSEKYGRALLKGRDCRLDRTEEIYGSSVQVEEGIAAQK